MNAVLATSAGSLPHRRFPILRQLFVTRFSRVLLGFVIFVALVVILGPIIARYGENRQDLIHRLKGPTGKHWLGTDSFGRDNLSLLLYATRRTMLAALEAVGVGVLLGVPAGIMAGLPGRRRSVVLDTVSDTLLALPPLVLALAIVGIRGPSLTNAMIAIGIVLAPVLYRLARATASEVARESFIEAAQTVGCSPIRLAVRHVLPNTIAPLVVQVTFSLGYAIVAEAGLSFLGVGVQPPGTSLGLMLRDAFATIRVAQFPVYPPGIAIILVIMLFTALGDTLQASIGRSGSDH